MIEIKENIYKLCLFDTCALSDFLQRPKEWFTHFFNEFMLDDTVICYSIFTLSELFYRPELFEKYIDVFSVFPSLLLDGHESIFQKEVINYFEGKIINPVVLMPSAIDCEGLSSKQKLQYVIRESGFIKKTEYWRDGQKEVLNGITSLTKNYPPKFGKYTAKEIEDFVLYASTVQIGLRDRDFAKKLLISGENIDIDKFPSLRSTIYMVFYKFYPDKRKPTKSDVFDVIISSVLPYVDYFVTEGNMYDIIEKVKSKNNFFRGLKPYKLKDIKRKIDEHT